MTSRRRSPLPLAATLALPLATALLPGAQAQEPGAFLNKLHHNTTLASTVPDNGDANPYAVFVAPVSAGKLGQGDVLVGNFNDAKNLQGRGTTIMVFRPATKAMTLFAAIPPNLAGCPGGVGLTTAMVMLKSGWVLVGSLPSTDGTTATKGEGCLIVLDSQGKVAGTIAGHGINGPWGNIAVVEQADTATIFVSNTGFGVGAPEADSPVVNQATILRLSLATSAAHPPRVTGETVIGSGFGAQADKGVFIIGPTGLALGRDGTLYVSDAIGNRITAIPDALARTTSAGTGREVTKSSMLQRPLALVMASNGHLLTTNGLDGRAVEIDPTTGKQLAARWLDVDKAQSPPGSGDLFGLAMTPSGDGFYYVEDDVNTLVLAH